MWEDTDQKNSEYEYFLRSASTRVIETITLMITIFKANLIYFRTFCHTKRNANFISRHWDKRNGAQTNGETLKSGAHVKS